MLNEVCGCGFAVVVCRVIDALPSDLPSLGAKALAGTTRHDNPTHAMDAPPATPPATAHATGGPHITSLTTEPAIASQVMISSPARPRVAVHILPTPAAPAPAAADSLAVGWEAGVATAGGERVGSQGAQAAWSPQRAAAGPSAAPALASPPRTAASLGLSGSINMGGAAALTHTGRLEAVTPSPTAQHDK